MAILHIVQFSLPDMLAGYTVRTQAIVAEQYRLGLDPLVVTSPRHPGGREEKIGGVQHYRCVPEKKSRSVWLRDRARVAALAKRIEQIVEQRRDIRLLHSHSPVLCGLAALRAGRRLGLPVIYELRGLWNEAMRRSGGLPLWRIRYTLARFIERGVCRAADAVVTISEGLRSDLIARGVRPEQVQVVTNGVDPRAFAPRPSPRGWRERLSLGEGPIILYLGALREYEGIDMLLEAFPNIARQHPGAQLVVVGDGESRTALEEAARSQPNVHLFPPVSHQEVADWYAAADLLIYPRMSSRATELVTPLKPLEAMAMGKAICASDVGGLRELLQEGEAGRLFPAGDVRALSEAVLELLNDEPQRRRMGETARRAAVERYDWSIVIRSYQNLYRSLGGIG